jgi:hypothetical protein
MSICNYDKTSINTNIFGCDDENDLLNFAWKDSHALVVLWLEILSEAQIWGRKSPSSEI